MAREQRTGEPTPRPLRILVVGGGIGGLCAAIALRRNGFHPVVLERSPELREAGAAITLWSNAILAARSMGLDDICRVGDEVQSGVIRSPRGTVLMRTPVADVGRQVGAPSICVARHELMRMLRSAMPSDTLHEAADVVGVRQDADGVVAQLADGREHRGDLLVGADGLRSNVRAHVLGPSEPRYAGHHCFRAMVDFSDPALPRGVAFETWGTGDSFGVVPMSDRRVYWFANASMPLQARTADSRAELMQRYGSWHEPIARLIEATPPSAVLCHPVFDRDPVTRWGHGRITLLGDAAHPATPDLGQGGCLAIEDAVVLADALRSATAPEAGLRAYERRRIPRTNWVTRKSRWFGRISHEHSPALCRLRNLLVRLTPGALTLRDFKTLVSYRAPDNNTGDRGPRVPGGAAAG